MNGLWPPKNFHTVWSTGSTLLQSHPNTTALQKQVWGIKLKGHEIKIQNRAANVMNHRSGTVGDNHYIRVWCALHVTFKRLLTDVHHNVLDWPIEFLNHLGVRHSKCFMKPLQSLFLLVYWCLDLWSQPYVPPRRDEDYIIIYILMPALLLTGCSIAAHIIKDITPTVTLTCLLVLHSSSWIFKKKRDWSQSNLIPPWIELQLVQLL